MRKSGKKKADTLARDRRTEAIQKALSLPLIPGLEALMDLVGDQHALKPKLTGTATTDLRWHTMHRVANELWGRFKLVKWKNLGEKHIRFVVVEFLWAEHCVNRLSLKSVKCYLSTFRVMVDFMGKPGCVKDLAFYMPDVPREAFVLKTECVEDYSWDFDVIKAIEEQFRPRYPEVCDLVLAQYLFGLRIRESCRFDIHQSVRVDATGKMEIRIFKGTKNGLPRWQEVNEDWVRVRVDDLLARYPEGVRLGAKSKYASPKSIENHYQYVLRRLGYTKKELGITSHGLRHGFNHRRMEALTGEPVAVKGGDPRRVPPQRYRAAQLTVTGEMGHRRPMNAYGGLSQRSRRIDEAIDNFKKGKRRGRRDEGGGANGD